MTLPLATAIPDETSPLTRKIGYFLGPALFLLTFAITPPSGMDANAWNICGLALWMACWWITEAMPLPVTSLLPIVIIPTLEINTLKQVLHPYSSSIIFLILGGFIISLAMQKWNLHLRIGLGILKLIGRGEKSVLAGVMLATAFMGMWISNTATAIMMLPMAISMAQLLSSDIKGDNHFVKALILGVTYGCVIGGLASFIGAPTNAILVGFMEEHYGHVISLADWMMFGVPMMLALLAFTWGMLTLMFLKKASIKANVREVAAEAFVNLGAMTREEKIVCIVFSITASLWMFSHVVENMTGLTLDDSVVSIIGALLLFLVPTNKKMDHFALNWKDTAKLPWGILIFFGGSMALSQSLTDTGVTTWLSHQLSALEGMNLILIVVLVVLLLVAVSELMSNVATITAFLPILAAMASAMHINPLLVMVPATLAASCAFMLPGASAPNALAFGTEQLKMNDMIRPGLILDVVSGIIITLFAFTLIAWTLGIDVTSVPQWALKE